MPVDGGTGFPVNALATSKCALSDPVDVGRECYGLPRRDGKAAGSLTGHLHLVKGFVSSNPLHPAVETGH